MRELWMRLMSLVVIVWLILGYNSVLEARAKDEEIAKLNAKIENTESLEDEDSKNGSYKDGTYTGTGTGFSGPITVQVVIEDGKIKDITILSATDDSPYLQNASALLKQIVALQSTNVDTVSGATYSSRVNGCVFSRATIPRLA